MFQLIQRHSQLLLFGILTAMFSGPGQTFLISLFIPSMAIEFKLNPTQIATVYSFATLVSAFFLPLTGYILDRARLAVFTLIAGILLTIGCLTLSLSQNIIMMFFGFLLVRNLGQGTLSMISSTTMARFFGSKRGKALGISNLGYPLSEAIFPFFITLWIMNFGWRSGWVLLALLILLFFSPCVLILLKNSSKLSKNALEEYTEKKIGDESSKSIREMTAHWSLKEVFKDWRVYLLILPSILAPALLTGLFFHQSYLMELKGWSMSMISVAFIVYAITRGSVSFLVGPLIDRFSAVRLLPLALVPMGFGLLCLMYGNSIFWGFVYLSLCGITIGIDMTIKGAVYAELYGTKQLGSIKGVMSSLMVLSTAILPVLMGRFLSSQDLMKFSLWFMLLSIVVATIFALLIGVFTKKINKEIS